VFLAINPLICSVCNDSLVFNASFVKIVFSFRTNYEMFPFACFFRFRFIMYLVLALLKVALVNFTLNEYMIMQ